MRPPLEDIAAVWLEHWDPTARGFGAPTQAVADHWGVVRPTGDRWVRHARAAGLLPASTSASVLGKHHPARARLTSEQSVNFTVCRECLTPWPCPTAPESPLGNAEAPESRSTP